MGSTNVTDRFPGGYEARPWYRKSTDPDWGPPDDELGSLLPVRLLAATTSKASVVVSDLIAYSMGFEFMVTILYSGKDPRVDPMGSEHHYVQGGDTDRCLRFGLEYADSVRLTNLDWVAGVAEQRPENAPHLTDVWGGGGGDMQSRNFLYRWWVLGFPPPGMVMFAIEWPAADIRFAKLELVDGSLVESAGRIQRKLWTT